MNFTNGWMIQALSYHDGQRMVGSAKALWTPGITVALGGKTVTDPPRKWPQAPSQLCRSSKNYIGGGREGGRKEEERERERYIMIHT